MAQNLTYSQPLIQAGLNPEQAAVYEVLLKIGPSPARRVAQNSPYKRSLVYKILDELIALNLATKKDEIGRVSVFEPSHPLKLKELLEKQEQRVKEAATALDSVLGNMTLAYGMISGRPGIKFYEGRDGIIKIYEEILKAGKPIDSIEDKGEMAAFIPEYFPQFIKKRVKLGIKNRVIAPADNKINIDSQPELRETRFIPTADFPFRMDIKITGRLVSLITFQKEHPVGVLVDNREIADNFLLLFEFFWKSLEKNSPPREEARSGEVKPLNNNTL